MKKISESPNIRTFLDSTPIMSLATVGEDGTPHCAIVIYDYDDQNQFYIATNRDSTKAKNINDTGKASFAIVSSRLDLTLQGSGKAHELKGPEMVKQMKILLKKANNAIDGWSPISKYGADQLVIYKITPTRLTFLDIASTDDMFSGLKFENLMDNE